MSSSVSSTRPASSSRSTSRGTNSNTRENSTNNKASSPSRNRANSRTSAPTRTRQQPRDESRISRDVRDTKAPGSTPNFANSFTARPGSSAEQDRRAGEQAAQSARQGGPTDNPGQQQPGGLNSNAPLQGVIGRRAGEIADWTRPASPNAQLRQEERVARSDGHRVTPTTPQDVNRRHLAERPGHTPGADNRFGAHQVQVGPRGAEGVRVLSLPPGVNPQNRPAANDFFATNRELAQAGETARQSNGRLSPSQVLQDRLALPNEPTHAARVSVPPGSRVDVSVIAPQNFNGQTQNGGALQRKALDPVTTHASEARDVNSVARENATASRLGRAFQAVGRVVRPLGIASDINEIRNGLQQDGGTIGRNTVQAASGVAGGWGGAIAGAKAGAVVGTFIGGPIGTVIGGVAGGVIGGIAGSALGRWVGSWF